MKINPLFRAKGIALLLLGGLLGSCGKKEAPVLPPQKVNVIKAVQQDVALYEDFVAQVYGAADVDIRTRVEGWVTAIHFKEGSRVKKGALLYTMDDIEYSNRVSRAESDLNRAKTELVRTENELSRVRPLTELNALSKKDLDNAQASYDAAKALVGAYEATLQNAKVELGYTRVYAPFDGIVGISNVRVGDYVSRMGTSSVLTTVSSVEGVRVRFQISEREYLRLVRMTSQELEAAKKDVQLLLADGSIYSEKGQINFADREIDPKTGTLTIEALFTNPQGILRPGLFVKARILMSTAKDAVLVPQRSVFQLQNLSQLYTVTDSSTLKAITVTTGQKIGDGWIIKSGLKAGDRVAVVGNASLTPNSKIEIVEIKWPEEAKQ